MKKKKIHLYGPSIVHTYTTICGLNINANYKDTVDKKKVTCKKCIKIIEKKNKQQKGNKNG